MAQLASLLGQESSRFALQSAELRNRAPRGVLRTWRFNVKQGLVALYKPREGNV